VGLREGSSSWEDVQDDGLEVATTAEAADRADAVQILIPDTVQPGTTRNTLSRTSTKATP